MARIADEELERLKQEVSVQRLAEAKGVKLKRHGKDLLGLCPFHDDKSPSLVVTVAKNLWHCLGACQSGGGPIDWMMRDRGVSFRHAVDLLRADSPALWAPSSSSSPSPSPSSSPRPSSPGQEAASESDEAVMGRVVAYYHATLKQSAEAQAYLQSRGLWDLQLVERYQLGFANRTLGYRLPSKDSKAGQALREQLQRLGILRESGHEHFNGSVVVPVLDARGRVVEMYGRKIGGEKLRKGTPLHLYLPGAHRGVFNLEALQGCEEVILCESLLDALTFVQAGFTNVTASYGVEGFTSEHLSAFKELGVRAVKIAYDRDEAGDRAAQKLSERLQAAGIGSYRVMFPHGLDANAYALKVTPAAKSLQAVLHGAQWLGQGRAPSESASVAKTPAVSISAPSATSPTAASAPPQSISPLAAPQSPQVQLEQSEHEVRVSIGDRRYRVRGLSKNTCYERLKVNLFASREGSGGFFVDSPELYSARQRELFIKQAAGELGVDELVVKRDMGLLLLELERLQDEQIQAAMAPKKVEVELTEQEQAEALALLRDPKLVDRILSDYAACGVVGEETNKLVGYLAAVSRKLDEPLAVVIQSSSAAGKSSLMDAVLQFVPPEERVQYSAMTGQSLFYMGETDLSHKILAVAEEEGAQNASYALKLLQSEGELTIASTGKDPLTGRLVTQEYSVQGPVMIFLTTTAIEVDEELLNRCLVLTVDEGREQTRTIHELQRQDKTLAGALGRQDRQRIRVLHQNAQRLLRPLFVVNPLAEQLSFPDHLTRTRRDHKKYLSLIEAVTLLHQHQRPVKEVEHGGAKVRYIEATARDVEIATQLAHEALGHSLDELPPHTRRMLARLHELVSEHSERQGIARGDFRFSRRQLREHLGWSETQTRVHLDRLVSMEYVLPHRGSRGSRYVYELLYDGQGQDGSPFVAGLVSNPGGTTTTSRGQSATSRGQTPTSRVLRGHFAGTSRDGDSGPSAEHESENGKARGLNGKALLPGASNGIRPSRSRGGASANG